MNPCSIDIKDILVEDINLGLEFGKNLFIGLEPTEPSSCITIFDTGGLPPQLMLSKNDVGYEYPTINIRSRNTSYVDGWKIINDIKTLLHNMGNFDVLGGVHYTIIYCASGPAFMGWDENNRARFTVNFNLQRR